MRYKIKDLSFSYNNKDLVLKNISLEFQEGHFYGILGPNGCGKSTLMDLLIRYLTPDKGDILLYDRPLTSYGQKELSKKVALVAQTTKLNFPFSVKDVVMMGRHPYIDRFRSPSKKDLRLVEEAMVKTDIFSLKDRFVTELSGGEKDRVIIARALAQDTPIIILDEASANLDINHAIHILTQVKKEATLNNKTVISIFHDINLAALFCDKVCFMKNGEIKAEGDIDKVLTDDNLHSIYNVRTKVSYNSFSGKTQVAFKTPILDET